jgi:F-type H+-transporting ATPase subunit gamma
MPSLIDIRRRIRSVKNTQQITKAMKMVSAAKLRRAQERVIAARPYAGMLDKLLSNVVAAARLEESAANNPMLAAREEKRIMLILVTADRGLAGAFNGNLIKAASVFMEEHKHCEIELEALGRKGRDFYRKRNVTFSGELAGASEKPQYANAAGLAARIVKRYSDDELDAVYLLYNEFKSVLTQKLTITRILPVMVSVDATPEDYIYEQPVEELLASLLPKYIEVGIFRAMLESAAAEFAARMTAMDAASSNAAEMIDKLTLYMNRVRQASITREIIEVVSGASAQE